MEDCGSNEPTSSYIQPPVVDCMEKKRERERERYAQMNTDGKNELLARRNATYQQKRSLSGKRFVIDDFFKSIIIVVVTHCFYFFFVN
jgi:hypothetical protein